MQLKLPVIGAMEVFRLVLVMSKNPYPRLEALESEVEESVKRLERLEKTIEAMCEGLEYFDYHQPAATIREELNKDLES